MLKTKILAGSITNLTDARYFAAWEVEWMGFNLNPADETFMPPVQVQAIKEWVEGPKIVGEFSVQSYEEIEQLASDLELDAIQLGMFTDLSTLLELDTDLPIIKEIIIQKDSTVEEVEAVLTDFAPHVQHFILDFEKSNWSLSEIRDHNQFSIDFLQEVASQYPTLIRLSAGASDLDALLEELPIVGLKVQGGAEEKVGYKSFDELDELFEELEELI